MDKIGKVFIIGFISANVIWFSYILIISHLEAMASVIFWGAFQTAFGIWIYATLEFLSPIKFDGGKNMILISDKKVPLDTIHYIAVVHFQGCYDSLALGYISKKGKPVIKITGESKDFKIMEFCNILRRMKGWQEQEKIKDIPGGQFAGYYKWKRDVKRVVQTKHDNKRQINRGIEEAVSLNPIPR
jgi:hypothetical protein